MNKLRFLVLLLCFVTFVFLNKKIYKFWLFFGKLFL